MSHGASTVRRPHTQQPTLVFVATEKVFIQKPENWNHSVLILQSSVVEPEREVLLPSVPPIREVRRIICVMCTLIDTAKHRIR